jgi:Tfp pilus assembly protein PilV
MLSARLGVSLPEVLVAAALLAIGVGGTLSALATALRFRAQAMERESVAAAAASRLAWLESNGCASPDTTITSGSQPLSEHWQLTRQTGQALLRGDARFERAGRRYRLALETGVLCK